MYQLKVRWGKRIKRAWLITTLPHQSISGRNQPISFYEYNKKETVRRWKTRCTNQTRHPLQDTDRVKEVR